MAEKTKYKVKANEFEFSFTKEQVDNLDFVKRSAGSFNVLVGHRSVNALL